MLDDIETLEEPSQNQTKVNSSKRLKEGAKKNIFLREIEMNSVKEALLKEIDISKLKESLVVDLKEALLKEIDISGIKETLLKEIDVKDLVKRDRRENDSKEIEVDHNDNQQSLDEISMQKKKAVNLPGYKYGLVDSCVKHHQDILKIYDSIISSAKDKEYEILPLMLSQFSKTCFDHFNEVEQLYTFMKALAGSRSEIERRVANEFSSEMKNVSLELFSILNQSKYIPVNDSSVDGFLEEFEKLGEILKDRIGREETILYPMYEGSRQVVDIC